MSEISEQKHENMTIRTLGVNQSQFTCEGHGNFYTMYWTAGVTLGRWLHVLRGISHYLENQPIKVTIYWWASRRYEEISLEELYGELGRLGAEILEAEIGLIRIDLIGWSVSLAWQVVPTRGARWLVYPPLSRERQEFISILSEVVDSDFTRWLIERTATADIKKTPNPLQDMEHILSNFKSDSRIPREAYEGCD